MEAPPAHPPGAGSAPDARIAPDATPDVCFAPDRARYRTPTGEPCPRTVRVDGSVEGSGECYCCGYCLALETAAWPAS